MQSRPYFQPLVIEDTSRAFVWTLSRKADRLAFSPATQAFVAPGPYTPPTAAAPTPANSDCYMPMLRCPDGLAANLVGMAPGVPFAAKGDGYYTVILDAATGETIQGPTQVASGSPYAYEVSVAVVG